MQKFIVKYVTIIHLEFSRTKKKHMKKSQIKFETFTGIQLAICLL